MGDVGDVHLEKPATVIAAFNVNGVVEIARGFTIDGDDGQVAEILTARAVRFGKWKGKAGGILEDFRGKGMWKMVLAYDDFGIDAEVAGTPQDFDDATNGSGTAPRIVEEFNVDDCAIELGNVGEAAMTQGLFLGSGKELFAESGGELVAGEEFDIVLHARVVGDDDGAAGNIAELTDNGRVRSTDNAHNAALGAACAEQSTEASDLGDDVVTMHGVFNLVAGDKDVAIDVGESEVGYNETVAIRVVDQATADFVAGSGFVLSDLFRRRSGRGGRRGLTLTASKKEALVSQLLDQPALLELGEHG